MLDDLLLQRQGAVERHLVEGQHLVDRRLRQIRGGDAGEMVRQAWAAHVATPGATDGDGVGAAEGGLFTANSIVELANCIGAETIARVLWVLACDYSKRSGGLPDLVLWRPDTLQVGVVRLSV